MQWQGRASSGGGCCFFDPMKLPVDPALARDVLDRHNVAWMEWLVLASLEHSTDRRGIVRRVTESASKLLGIRPTKKECLRHLEACLRNGWMRDVDDDFARETLNLLHADAALTPVPFDPVEDCVEVDFTVDGAKLYRMVSAEIFGGDWEDGLVVEDSYYREEHRYCASDAGLAAITHEYAELGEMPKSIRTVRIGPWCVYWWNRFRSGYRLELTFGEL